MKGLLFQGGEVDMPKQMNERTIFKIEYTKPEKPYQAMKERGLLDAIKQALPYCLFMGLMFGVLSVLCKIGGLK